MNRFAGREFSRVRGALSLVIVLVTIAVPASAEVMDKEIAPSDISRALLLSLLLALPAATVHRWLLLPLFIFGPVQELAYAWREWHDPIVGPSISREAGPAYGFLADGAMAVAVVAYLALWLVSSRFRHRLRNPLHDLMFSTALFSAALLHAYPSGIRLPTRDSAASIRRDVVRQAYKRARPPDSVSEARESARGPGTGTARERRRDLINIGCFSRARR
jgi:hypothetical protein